MASKPALNSKMSSKNGKKREAPSDNGGGATAAPTASKRQKITTIVQSTHSLLLNTQPEIFREV